MSIDFSQFKDGEEVAVTFVGTVQRKYGEARVICKNDDGQDTANFYYSLEAAVDAYKIEPGHKKGDLFRYSYNNSLFVYEGDGYYRCLMFADGGVASYKHPLSQKGNFNLGTLTPVKVVEK